MDLGQGPQPQLGNPWLTYLGNMLPDRPWDYYTGPHLAQAIRNIGDVAPYVARTALDILPGSGEVSSARDSAEAAAQAREAIGAGDYGLAASSGIESFTAGLGALPVVGLGVRGAGRIGNELAELVRRYATGTTHRADDMMQYLDLARFLNTRGHDVPKPRFELGEISDDLLRRIQAAAPTAAEAFASVSRRLYAPGDIAMSLVRERPKVVDRLWGNLQDLALRPEIVVPNRQPGLQHRPMLMSERFNPESGKFDLVVMDADLRRGEVMMPTVMESPWRYGLLPKF